MPRLTMQAALGVGLLGALEDVSSYVRLPDGVARSWGRGDAYFGAEPGTFSLVLDNADGRFTPENASSPLQTKLSEGARACLSIGGRLTAGTVRTVEPVFPGGDSAWAAVRVTCDDVLGFASRTDLLPTADALNAGADTLGLWKFNEDAGETRGFDSGMRGLPPFAADQFFPATVTFGGASLPWSTDTQLVGGTSTGTSSNTFTWISNVADFGHDANSGGFFSFWYTPISNVEDGTTHFQMQLALNNGQVIEVHKGFGLGGVSGKHFGVRFSGGASATSALLEDGVPVFVSVGVDVSGADLRAQLYVNGELVGSRLQVAASTTSAGLSAQWVKLTLASSSSASSYLVSRFSHTRSLPREDFLLTGDSEAEVIAAVAAATPGLTVATLPAGLSGVPVALPDFAGQSSLDVLNEVQNTEQGHLYATTSGTLLAPVEELAVRERARPRTVKCSFDVANELSGAPRFVRDITNLVSRVRVRGATSEVTVQDATLVARAGNASDTVSVLFTGSNDMRSFGQDRLLRGSNTAMRIASVVIDLMTTPTDRSADVLGLVPGDRVRFTNLPSGQLGFTTWDGWFLGAVESHTLESHAFELFFEPVLRDVALYDTDRYSDRNTLTLADLTGPEALTFVINTTGPQLTTTDLPLTLQVGNEQVTVTACTSATPQSATVTRGVNGTTAATHLAGSALTVIPVAIYGF